MEKDGEYIICKRIFALHTSKRILERLCMNSSVVCESTAREPTSTIFLCHLRLSVRVDRKYASKEQLYSQIKHDICIGGNAICIYD